MNGGSAAFRVLAVAALVAACVGGTPDVAPPLSVPPATVEPPPPAEPPPTSFPAELPPPTPAAPTSSRAVVFGQVLRSDDAPAVGQRVSLVDDFDVVRETTTDASGAFVFGAVAPGHPFELRVAAEGCATVRLPSILLDQDEGRDVGTLRLGPPVRVVVRVRTWDDEPVAGATVEAYRRAADAGNGLADRHGQFPEPVERTTTDAAGEATFTDAAAGAWTFVADGKGFAAQGRTVRIGTRAPVTIGLRLEPGTRLDGRVLDADGAPAVGAEVVLGQWNWPDPWRPFRAVADMDGRFEFDGVASGNHSLRAGPAGAPPFLIARLDVPEVRRLDVRLPRGSVARGVVTDADTGLPIEGALVHAGEVNSGLVKVSDAKGRYELVQWVPQGTWLGISVQQAGYGEPKDAHDRYAGMRARPGDVVTRDFRLLRGVPHGPRWSLPFLGLSPERVPGGSVRGVVVDAGGAAVAGAEVRLEDGAVTDAEGMFQFDDVPPGKRAVTVSTPDGEGRSEVLVDSRGRATVSVRLARCDVVTVRGRVRTADGAALPPGTRVEATYWSKTSPGQGSLWSRPAAVLPTGEFVLRIEPSASRFLVRAEAPGLAAWFWDKEGTWVAAEDPACVDVVDGRTEYAQDVVLAPGGDLAGRVIARDGGAPVADAWILVRCCCILGSPSNFVRAVTDADGRFRIPHVFRRKWAVGVEAPGFVTKAVWIDTGQAPVTIAVEREFPVAGEVRFADGRPAEGAQVKALLPDCTPLNPYGREDHIVGIVDAAGRFRITEIPPGRVTLEAGPRWNDPSILPTKVLDVEAGSTEVRIVVALAEISGVLVDAEGRPLARTPLAIRRAGKLNAASVTTDDAGRFRFVRMESGAYEASASATKPDGTTGELLCGTVQAGDVGVVLRLPK